MLAGAGGGYACEGNKKDEATEAEPVRICKALVEIVVRQSACGIGEPELFGASREEQAEKIEEMSPNCKDEAYWRGDVECKSPNMPVLEQFARALREAGDCDTVLAIESPHWCLNEMSP